ncbi:MAG TPA: ATP-binding protein [Casimicrobiaceae bacterium]|nr:ATP-binding protein [Casimicrobiaceae bacterium]
MDNRHTAFNWIVELFELGLRTTSGAHPQRALQDILEHIVRGFDAQGGSIALTGDAKGEQLELAAGTDLPPGWVGTPLSRGMGLYGHVVATGQPLLVNGDAAETGLPPRSGEDGASPPHSAMCWPLVAAGRIIGALAVSRTAERPRFTVQELDRGQPLTRLVALVVAHHRMHVESESRIVELSTLNATMKRLNELLEDAQTQGMHSLHLASIGQLSEGVAHEINRPLDLVQSNLTSLDAYLARILSIVAAYTEIDDAAEGSGVVPFERVRSLREGADIAFLSDDIDCLLDESREGLLRVKRIVQDLRQVSPNAPDDEWEAIDLHRALDHVLDAVRGDIKYKATVVREYGAVPEIECLPARLSQVFHNLIVNAGQAIEGHGTIRVATGATEAEAWVKIEDTGGGIRPGNLTRIFEPFFTTRLAGQGTGLGLSIANSIVRKHAGRIDVESDVGRGSRFTVWLPLRRAEPAAVPAALAPAMIE